MPETNLSEKTWLPMKFGGTSLATAGDWQNIASLLSSRLEEGYRPVLICSAIAGATDTLKRFVDAADAATRRFEADNFLELHRALAAVLELDICDLIAGSASLLESHVDAGVSTDDFALQAQVLAVGELLSSRIGAAWLNQRGFDVTWQDAREALVSRPEPERKRRQFLDARCPVAADPALQQRWSGFSVIVTQGFLGSNSAGQTVLFGRGGSDTSAAYFAAALEVGRVEIWSDVPGLFSTDPRMIAAARLLRQLDHQEALEIAAAGAAVIHPQCIRVAEAAGAELQLGQLGSDTFPGTVINRRQESCDSVIKAISMRGNMVTLLLENQDMRHAVGFLARVFALFAEHGISLDQVATSETTTTVTLDLSSNHIDLGFVEELVQELSPHCKVRILAPSACISLVGRGIRKVLSRVSQSMKIFESEQLWLASYSANDLAFTLVVPEKSGTDLVNRLHAELIESNTEISDEHFGPDWSHLQDVNDNA